MVNKRVAAQLEKLKGEEWDSDSDNEQEQEKLQKFESNSDFVALESQPQPPQSTTTKTSNSKTKDKACCSSPKRTTGHKQQSSVIYLGRIPHGFYEKEMRGFFNQFGKIVRLRLSRNKTSGKSKHFAFLEFEEPEVAEIVAKTMNGYRLFDHTLSCHVLPLDAIHDQLFVGANKTFKQVPRRAIARRIHNAPRDFEQIQQRNKRLVKREAKKRHALELLGIDYTFPGYEACVAPPQQHITFEE